MSWRLEINHMTRYRYDRPVIASYNEARLTPMSTPGQFVIEAQVAVRPATQLFCFTDYWGALVHAFDVHSPHQSLLVTSRAVVETMPAGRSSSERGEADYSAPDKASDRTADGSSDRPSDPASWDDLTGAHVADRFYEFLAPSRFVTPGDLSGMAKDLRCRERGSGGRRPGCRRLGTRPARVRAWGHPRAHVSGGGLARWTGRLPGLRPPEPGCTARHGHPGPICFGLLLPRSHGGDRGHGGGRKPCLGGGMDGRRGPPTTRPTGSGWANGTSWWRVGRDYADVAPVRGIYSGPPGSSTEVTVELVRRA